MAYRIFLLVCFTVLTPMLSLSSCVSVKTNANIEKSAPHLAPNILNSERIKIKFGSFGVKVLEQTNDYRFSNLYSNAEQQIMRTLALTNYAPHENAELKDAHAAIMSGKPIGETLTSHGFTLEKKIIFKGEVTDMPEQVLRMMRTEQNKFATVIYDMWVIKDGQRTLYSTITELDSPHFLSLSDLDQIYGAASNTSEKTVIESIDAESFNEERVRDILALLRQLANKL